MRLKIYFLVCVLACALAAHAANQPAIAVLFSDNAVRVTGVTRGGGVVLFGVERIIHDDSSESVIVWNEHLADTDGDGEVTLPLQKPLSPFTVMAAVDEDDARYIVATPGFIPVRIAPAGKLHGNDKGEPIEFANAMPYGEALVVRPKQGAWVSHGWDGSLGDADGRTDGRITIRFASMKAARGRPDFPGPDKLLPRDLVIVINPVTLAVYADDVKGGR